MSLSPSDRCTLALTQWCADRGPLPSVYSASAAKACFTQLARNCRLAIEAVEKPTADRADTLNLFKAQEKQVSFTEWAVFMDPDDERVSVLNGVWNNRIGQLANRLAQGSFPRTLKKLVAHETDPSLRAAMRYTLNDLQGRKRGQSVTQLVHDQYLARLHREEATFPQGVDFTEEEMAELPAYIRRGIAQESARSGWDPRWLPRGHPDLVPIMGFLNDEKAREVTWVQSQPNTSQPEELKALLSSRRKECRKGSFFAQQALSEHAEPNPVFVQRVLHGALGGLAAAQTRRLAAFQVAANRDHGGIDVAKPWNAQVVFNAAYSAVPDAFPLRDDLFPVLPTLHKVVPEIIRAIGWQCDRLEDAQSGAVGFDCTRPDGHQVRLWVRPFLRSSDRFEDYGGLFTTMGQAWNGYQDKLTCAIDLYMPEDSTGFDPVKLTQLAHEIGHMAHYMSMPANGVFGELVFPSDLVEFPSQLLERYVTPERLAAWVRPTATAHYRTAVYWKNIEPLASQIDVLEEAVSDALSASLDLDMHLPGHRSIDATHNHLRAMVGMNAADPRTTEHRGAIMWKSDYAARNYIYLWGKLLIEQVLPTNATAASVARCYREFIAHVGSKTVVPVEVRQCWKGWQGETLRQSITQGMKKWTHRLTEQNDRVLATNPVLREAPARRRRMNP